MNSKFLDLIEETSPSFEQLMNMRPVRHGCFDRFTPKQGVYLFSERNNGHLYVGGRIIFEQDTEGTVTPEQLITRLHLHLGSREKPRARTGRVINPVQIVGQVLWKTLGFWRPSMRLKLAFD